MIEIRRILCPIDFSAHSRRALDHAVAMARWYGSAITVIHVHRPIPVPVYGPPPIALAPVVLTDVDRDRMLADVKRFIERESLSELIADVMLYEGNPAAEILSCAGSLNADLLVLGTHGRSGFERLVLGSVTEKVLRKAICAVLTVPPALPDAVPSAPGLFKEILCPVDFSATSMRALHYAMSIAQEANARLAVLHVIAHEFENAADVTDLGVSIASFIEQREDDVRRRLKDAIPEAVAAYCSVETLMARGTPWREVLRIAAERRSDLIVMGVQGRGAVDLLFFGSTTQQVVRAATCPVLTLRRE